MNITPVNLNFGKFYDFKNNDPRKSHRGFELGMPDNKVVEHVADGDNYHYPITAGQLRASFIRQQGYDFETHYPDSKIVGTRFDSGCGCPYFVTAGQLREEIIEEEKQQLKYEEKSLADEALKNISGGTYVDIPSWDRYPY